VLDFPPDPEGVELYYQTPREEVPDVVGMELDEATDELYEAGFNIEVEYVNAEEPEDEVVSQDPENPEKLKQGEVVKLEVSNGLAPEVEMVDLVGLSSGEAVAILTALREATEIDFTWELVTVPVSNPAQRDQVLATRPEEGGMLTEGTVVVIRYTVYQAGG